MIYERKITAGLDDIKAIIFECKNCKSKVSLSPDKVGEAPYYCSQATCKHPWRPPDISPGQHQGIRSPFANFLDGLAMIRKWMTTDPNVMGFTIMLEFDESEMLKK